MSDGIVIKCSRCGSELTEPGGLAFSPPHGTVVVASPCLKYHLCVKCWADFETFLSRPESAS